MRTVDKHYVKNGSTVTLCALDISKAFDRVDHYVHYCNLLWIDICQVILLLYFIIVISALIVLAGVRQGGILALVLFAVYIDVFYLMIESSKCWM